MELHIMYRLETRSYKRAECFQNRNAPGSIIVCARSGEEGEGVDAVLVRGEDYRAVVFF